MKIICSLSTYELHVPNHVSKNKQKERNMITFLRSNGCLHEHPMSRRIAEPINTHEGLSQLYRIQVNRIGPAPCATSVDTRYKQEKKFSHASDLRRVAMSGICIHHTSTNDQHLLASSQ